MKKNFYITILMTFIAFPIASFGQIESSYSSVNQSPPNQSTPSDAPIITVASKKAHIRSVYADINRNLSNYRKKVVIGAGPAPRQSTEGALEVVYFDDRTNRMIKVEETYFGEMGKRKLEYYFDNYGLCFALEQVYHYNSPMYVKKNGEGMLAFDINKSRIEEHRYYFSKDGMFEWINENGDKVVPNSQAFKYKDEVISSVSLRHQ